jgi:ABC-type sugar transport system substrate-binding protein
MLRRFSLLISILLVATLVLAACGRGREEPAEQPAAPAAEEPAEEEPAEEEPAEEEPAEEAEEPAASEEVTATEELTETEEAGATDEVTETEEAGATDEVTETEEAGAAEGVTETEEAGATEGVTETEEAGAGEEVTSTEEVTATEEAGDEPAAEPTEEAAEEGAAVEFNGGLAVNPPDKAGQDIVVFDVPKLIGIDYFNATGQGMQEAAEELGNVTVTQDGPTEGRVDRQIEFIDNFITQQPDAIVYASNDPVAIAPVLESALAAGIHVVGYDADAEPQARTFFVNQASFEAIGKALIDSMVAQVGEEAQVAIVTSSLTAPNQNAWIEEMTKYRDANYPGLEFVDTRPSEEDQNLAFQVTNDLLLAYPDLAGVFGLSSVAFPGAAEAVTQADRCGEVAVVGLSTPNTMRPYVEDGCVADVVLWNPVDLGYATIYAVRALIDGELTPESTTLNAGRLGELQINGSEILLGDPFIYTAENIADFNF